MNKGFTLVELLAVVIILSILTFLVSISVTKIVRDSKKDLYESQIASIKSSVMAWGADNFNRLPNVGECKYLKLKDLKEYGLLDEEIINPKNSKDLSDEMLIKISSDKTIYGNEKTTYEIDVDVDDISSCLFALPICTLSEDSKVGKGNIGAKYECQVNEEKKYNFYVIGTNEDGTSNLIMEANIDENGNPIKLDTIVNAVHWTENNSTEGPITSMEYLYNATKTWINVEPISFTYKDREYQNITRDGLGYESIIATDGIAVIKGEKGNITATIGTTEEPLRARMPIYAVTYNNSYGIATEKGEIASKTESNEYLYLNLKSGNIDGYWSISSFYDASELGLYISSAGRGFEYPLNENWPYIGVRPVITVQL